MLILGGLAAAMPGAVPAQQQSQALTLEDCIQTALAHNPQLVSSAQSVVVARHGLRQARSSYAPQLTLNASDGLHGSSGGGAGTPGDGASLILGMTFWKSGRQASVAQSKANVRAATSSYADQRLSLAKLVADDYFAVLAAAELVGVARAGVEFAEQHRKQVAASTAVSGTVPPGRPPPHFSTGVDTPDDEAAPTNACRHTPQFLQDRARFSDAPTVAVKKARRGRSTGTASGANWWECSARRDGST
jgi:hypothetical protein